MKKTIIALYGASHQGKSSTIRIAADLLVEFALARPINIDEFDSNGDIKITFELNQHKVGIESQGDPDSRLADSLTEFARDECDLIICSTRTRGTTVDAVSTLSKSHGYDIIWITNYRSNEKNNAELNNLCGKHIFELAKQQVVFQ